MYSLDTRNQHLKSRPASEWAERIAKLPKDVRNACGRIVWWDFFADKLVKNADRHLDFYLNTVDEPKRIEDWVQALVSLGYNEGFATWRLGVRCKSFKKPLAMVHSCLGAQIRRTANMADRRQAE